MNIQSLLQSIAIIISIFALTYQIRRQRSEDANRELRLSSKLKIFYLCDKNEKTEPEIFDALRRAEPDKNFNEIEIRKAIYEMLSEDTLRLRKDMSFRARRFAPKKENIDTQDDN